MSQTAAQVNHKVQAFLNDLKGKTIDHVFFVACGVLQPLCIRASTCLTEAKAISSDLYSSNEFIQRNPVQLGENSLVILCSQSGNTPETVKAAGFARKKARLRLR